MDTPYVAFSNKKTLDGLPKIQAGDLIVCSVCQKKHAVEPPTPTDDADEASSLLLFYTCPETRGSYLAAVNGRNILGIKGRVSGSTP